MRRVCLVVVFWFIANNCIAVGFGKVSLYSYLNEPLSMEIELLGSDKLDQSQLLAQLASPKDFVRAGMERHFYLTKFKFEVFKSDLKTYLYISTDNTITHPFLDFLVDLSWPDGKLVKGYTLLIDPPPSKEELKSRPKPLFFTAKKTAVNKVIEVERKAEYKEKEVNKITTSNVAVKKEKVPKEDFIFKQGEKVFAENEISLDKLSEKEVKNLKKPVKKEKAVKKTEEVEEKQEGFLGEIINLIKDKVAAKKVINPEKLAKNKLSSRKEVQIGLDVDDFLPEKKREVSVEVDGFVEKEELGFKEKYIDLYNDYGKKLLGVVLGVFVLGYMFLRFSRKSDQVHWEKNDDLEDVEDENEEQEENEELFEFEVEQDIEDESADEDVFADGIVSEIEDASLNSNIKDEGGEIVGMDVKEDEELEEDLEKLEQEMEIDQQKGEKVLDSINKEPVDVMEKKVEENLNSSKQAPKAKEEVIKQEPKEEVSPIKKETLPAKEPENKKITISKKSLKKKVENKSISSAGSGIPTVKDSKVDASQGNFPETFDSDNLVKEEANAKLELANKYISAGDRQSAKELLTELTDIKDEQISQQVQKMLKELD